MNKLTLCLSLLRSVYLNFKFLPLDEAIKVPLLFHYKFKITTVPLKWTNRSLI